MIQSCYCPDFLLKLLTVLALQPFYGDYATQPCVARLSDFTHAARA
jgi:hypothetical protein